MKEQEPNNRRENPLAYRPRRAMEETRTTHSKNSGGTDRRGRVRTGADWFGFVCLCLMVCCSIFLLVNLLTLRMLPVKYLLLIIVVLLVLNAAHAAVQLPLRRQKGGKLSCGVIAIILSAAMVYGCSAMTSVQSALKRISNASAQETKTIDVIVLKNSSAQSLSDVQGQTFGILNTMDAQNLQKMTDAMSAEIGDVKTVPFSTLTELAAALYSGKEKAIIMDDAYMDSLTEVDTYKEFTDTVRIIYQYDVTTTSKPAAQSEDIDVTKTPFLVYLSGSDSRSSNINATGNSDVNILAVVNPQTRQILLLNTPRDYYVPLTVSNGVRDKLTHAGVYGIDCSMGTLEMLYGVNIPYYVRINFTGFETIVDALGGVTIYSDYTFDTGSHQFVAGANTVGGAAALDFVRERYSFGSGDNQRGKNQMAMIKAILSKATSPAILTNYQSLLNAVAGSFISNMPYEKMADLVQMQISDNVGWNIVSYAVTGTGDMTTTYTYPNEDLYVMRPDDTLVNTAKSMIGQVLSGETLQG